MADYADKLFLRQNRACSTIMMLPEEELEPDEYTTLLDAEQKMLEACKPFNDYAVMILEGEKPGVLLRNKIYRALDECDEATLDLESLLSDLD